MRPWCATQFVVVVLMIICPLARADNHTYLRHLIRLAYRRHDLAADRHDGMKAMALYAPDVVLYIRGDEAEPMPLDSDDWVCLEDWFQHPSVGSEAAPHPVIWIHWSTQVESISATKSGAVAIVRQREAIVFHDWKPPYKIKRSVTNTVIRDTWEKIQGRWLITRSEYLSASGNGVDPYTDDADETAPDPDPPPAKGPPFPGGPPGP